ncbi:type II toxin-antitoxin system RelE/ParE family toxin [Treponema vincentii]|uniref:type II toxin-antitoxin system RelE family toxin n=1 Tax=Treponema vincentii TaxID=69710 RepID=UPI0020A42D5F|nr:type II toxin-antitoxin system RelE/ParE family toxin [Treponema vincentii]UTC59912.1 type II toxin-antitoxin system RelE/ParE family toxin [Treponema vincentii]
MAYKIEFEAQALAEFSNLDGAVKKQIRKYIDKLAEREDPRTLGEPLQSNLSMFWKYRVGDYRLVAEIQDEKLVVLMLVIAHRRVVYKTADKRLNRK